MTIDPLISRGHVSVGHGEEMLIFPIFLRSEGEYLKERPKKTFPESKKGEPLHWPPWRFNDIVGYITVNYYEQQFKVFRYLPFVERIRQIRDDYDGKVYLKQVAELKRINRDALSRTKLTLVIDANWGLEMPILKRHTEEDLKQYLIKLLLQARKDLHGKRKWFIDLDYYTNLISCLDIRKYLKKLDMRKK